MFYGRVGQLCGCLWDTVWSCGGVVVGEEEESKCGGEGLAFLVEAGT